MFISSEEKTSRLSASLSLDTLAKSNQEGSHLVEVCPESEVDSPGPRVNLAMPEPKSADSEQTDGESRAQTLRIEPHHFRGRTKGAKNIPDFLRPIIGASAIFSGHKETALAFGISETSVDHINERHTGEVFVPNPEVKSKVEELVGKAQESAADRLCAALGLISNDKLDKLGAEKLSRVAADMSRVIEKTTEKKAFVGAQIVIMAPTQKAEEKYDVIDL